MYKIQIVDDEYIIRNGLKNSIAWESVNCKVISMSSNGKEGLEDALKLKPDIVITDIKMPVMDGISMAEAILKEQPNIKFIMITGFTDFNDAKDAIKLSAIDFIQKPIQDDELLFAIENAINHIESDNVKWDNERNKKLLELIEGGSTSVDLLNVSLNTKVRVISIQTHDTWLVGAYFSKIIKEVKNIFGNLFIEFVICTDNIFTIIISDYNKFNIHERLYIFQKNIQDTFDILVTIGVSTPNTLNDISYLYAESQIALSRKIKYGIGKIIFYGDHINYEKNRENIKIDYKEFNSLLSQANKQDILDYIDNVGDLCRTNLLFAESKAIYLDLHMLMINKIRTNELEVVTPTVYSSYRLRQARNIEELISAFKENFIEFFNVINYNIDKIRVNDEIIEYIKENFNEDLLLQNVADEFYMSPSTVSRRIKTRTDMNFSEFITFLRIDKSLLLLQTTDLTINEISLAVGYADYRYFSTVFKRRQGMTPTQYRSKYIS